jgi:hypothetical protein
MPEVILVHGLKRSGNHAIIHWLLEQEPMPFFNNVIPISPILAGRASPPSPVPFQEWARHHETPEQPYANLLQCRSIMLSLEDHELSVTPIRAGWRALRHVIVLRDARNLFASRIRKAAAATDLAAYPRTFGPIMTRAVNLWISHAKEALRETTTLRNCNAIYFNAWFSSIEYRRRVCEMLGIEFTDQGFAKVAEEGGGSSFDGVRHAGQNQDLQVLKRQEMLSDDEKAVLERVLDSPEVERLSRRLDEIYAA